MTKFTSREKEIVRMLKNVAKEKDACDENKKEKIIESVTQMEIPIRKRGSFGEFILLQFSFINRLVFLGQMLWLLLFSYAVWDRQIFHLSNEMLCLLSMAPPILLLFTVDEISHIYNQSMLEIECSTKYSLRKLVMVRLFLLSTINGIVLCIGILFAKEKLGLDVVSVLIYSLTPYVCMTFLLLLLMKKWKGQQLLYGAVSLYMLLGSVILIGRMEAFDIYRDEVRFLWGAVMVVGLIGIIYQFRNLWIRLEHFEFAVEERSISWN